MPCPMGDDWLQSVNYFPSPPPLFVRVIEENTVVIFQQLADACMFEEWMGKANMQVDDGYRTMRG